VSINKIKKLDRNLEQIPSRQIYNFFSYYLTKLLLYTPITANQATISFMIIGIIGSVLFIFNNFWYYLIGMGLINLWQTGDWCDGKIARYRKSESKYGKFLDWLNDYSITPILLLCISLGGNILPFGLIASISWFFVYQFRHTKEVINKVFPKIKFRKDNVTRNPRKFNIVYRKLKTYLQHYYIPIYLIPLSILSVLALVNFIAVLVIVFAIFCPIVWFFENGVYTKKYWPKYWVGKRNE